MQKLLSNALNYAKENINSHFVSVSESLKNLRFSIYTRNCFFTRIWIVAL